MAVVRSYLAGRWFAPDSGTPVYDAVTGAPVAEVSSAGLDFAAARGATTTPGMDEFYCRVMPAPPARIREEDFVPLAQLYGREARIFTDDWSEITPQRVAWHENDLAQLIGRLDKVVPFAVEHRHRIGDGRQGPI